MTQGPACHTRPFSWLTLQGTLRILMFDLFLFSYLPHCQNRSVTVGLNTESVLLLFFRVKSPSLFFLCPSFTRSHPGSCLSSVYSLHSPVPTFPLSSPSLSANDFSSASHIASPLPLLYVSWYLCSSSSPIVLSLSLFLFLPLTWVPFDETWIERGRVSAPCSSALRRGFQGKRQVLFTLNIIWHLIGCTFWWSAERRKTERFPMLREDSFIFMHFWFMLVEEGVRDN